MSLWLALRISPKGPCEEPIAALRRSGSVLGIGTPSWSRRIMPFKTNRQVIFLFWWRLFVSFPLYEDVDAPDFVRRSDPFEVVACLVSVTHSLLPY